MATNDFELNLQERSISAVSNLEVTTPYTCECGAHMTVTFGWPENLELTSGILLSGHCPSCSKQLRLPRARYWVENFQLMSEPAPEAKT